MQNQAGPDREHISLALLGNGMIAGELHRLAESRPWLRITGAFDRAAISTAGGWDAVLPVVSRSDLVVEVATQSALRDYGPSIIGSGTDLLAVSVGALAVRSLREQLSAGPGRLILATGAIGGIDHLRAMRLAGPFEQITFESRKKPSSLVQEWMDAETTARLEATGTEIVLMEDSAARVAEAFPASANVAAAVALATDGWDVVRARIVADPHAALTVHTITARNAAGECTFEVRNEPSPQRPRSSLVVAYSVLRSITDYRAGRLPGGGVPLAWS